MDEGNNRGNRSAEEQYDEYRRQVHHHQQQQQQQQQHYEQQLMAYGYHQQHSQMQHWNAAAHQPMYSVQQQHLYHHHLGYQYPLQPMDGVPLPLPPGIPGLGGSTDPLEAVLGPFPCTRLRNLPYDASLEDILLLFQGLVVIDVILVGNGEAFVIFANPMDFQMALQRDRQPIGRQFVEISAASRDQYYSAIARQHMQEQEGGRHLETSAGTSGLRRDEGLGDEQVDNSMGSTVRTLWTGAGVGSTASSIIQPLASSPTFSEPLVSSQQQLSQQQIASQQQQQTLPPGIVMSGRGASGSSRPTLHAPLQKRTGGGIQVGEHTGFLRMRGLPFSSTKEDIYHFFEGYNPVQESIVLTYRNDGRATGEAYVGFLSPEDSKRAMELHRRMMGSRYIELFISNKDEQSRAFARFGNR